MPGVDEFLLFRALNLALFQVPHIDKGEADRASEILATLIKDAGHTLVAQGFGDQSGSNVAEHVRNWSEDRGIEVVLVIGGIGLTERDKTISVLEPLFDKTLDGFAAAFHRSNGGISRLGMRACAGLIGTTFVFCLPDDADDITHVWNNILRDALDSRYRPSSLVDLIPRLSE